MQYNPQEDINMQTQTQYTHDKVVVFVSNSSSDGFREGDGDLMNKLVQNLNEQKIMKAVRVLENYRESLEQKLLSSERIIYLGDYYTTPDKFQKNMLTVLNDSQYKNMTKILYIGSRFDAVKDEKEMDALVIPIFHESNEEYQNRINKIRALDPIFSVDSMVNNLVEKFFIPLSNNNTPMHTDTDSIEQTTDLLTRLTATYLASTIFAGWRQLTLPV